MSYSDGEQPQTLTLKVFQTVRSNARFSRMWDLTSTPQTVATFYTEITMDLL